MKSLRRRTDPLPSGPVTYPSGTFVHTDKGYFYIVTPHKCYHLITKRVLDSWSPQRVVETSSAALKPYRVAAKMKFRNGSLIHNFADGKIYLIADGYRHHIASPDVLTRLGAKHKDVVTVSQDEINLHQEGEPLT